VLVFSSLYVSGERKCQQNVSSVILAFICFKIQKREHITLLNLYHLIKGNEDITNEPICFVISMTKAIHNLGVKLTYNISDAFPTHQTIV